MSPTTVLGTNLERLFDFLARIPENGQINRETAHAFIELARDEEVNTIVSRTSPRLHEAVKRKLQAVLARSQ